MSESSDNTLTTLQVLPPQEEEILADQGSNDIPLLPPPPESTDVETAPNPLENSVPDSGNALPLISENSPNTDTALVPPPPTVSGTHAVPSHPAVENGPPSLPVQPRAIPVLTSQQDQQSQFSVSGPSTVVPPADTQTVLVAQEPVPAPPTPAALPEVSSTDALIDLNSQPKAFSPAYSEEIEVELLPVAPGATLVSQNESAVKVPTQPTLIPVTPSMENLTNPDQYKYTTESGVPMNVGVKGMMTDPGTKHASVFASVYNICNYILGAGVLSMPVLADWNGLVFAGAMLVILGVYLLYTVFMLLNACEKAGCEDYDELVGHCLGPSWRLAMNWSVALGTIGILCAYMVLIGDFSENLANEAFGHSNRKLLIGVIGVCLVYPLCLLKNLNSLRFTSVLAITFVFGTVVAIIIDCVMYMTDGDEDYDSSTVTLSKASSKLFRSIPIALFSYMCHLIVVPTRKEMPNKSLAKTKKVTSLAFLICGVVYLCSLSFGYLRFRSEIDGNVLNTYLDDEKDVANKDIFTVCSSSFLFVIVFSYPMVSFSGRIGMHSLLFKGKPFTFFHNWFIVTAVFGLSLFVALVTEDVALVFGLVGAITSPAITIIFPSLCHISLSGKPFTDGSNWGASFSILVGVFVTITGIIYSIRDF
eukprot:GCRY01000689.1.p1 GENE.GCRY01000689.1~~GCRY01000689.1.p1  ORF type:complete len:646 (+),score=174.55 GCRY01000689.1:76-2013(+)